PTSSQQSAILHGAGCFDLLIESDRSVNALAGHLPMSRPAVSQHLRVLLDVGLVTDGRERRYRLVPAQRRPVRDWMAYYERFWDEHLERLEKHLTNGRMMTESKAKPKAKGTSRASGARKPAAKATKTANAGTKAKRPAKPGAKAKP